MKKNNYIDENINISDKTSIKGVITLYDEKGNLIFKKNNLVVNSGRKLLRDLFYSTFVGNGYSDSNKKLKICLGYRSNGEETLPSTVLSNFTEYTNDASILYTADISDSRF